MIFIVKAILALGVEQGIVSLPLPGTQQSNETILVMTRPLFCLVFFNETKKGKRPNSLQDTVTFWHQFGLIYSIFAINFFIK